MEGDTIVLKKTRRWSTLSETAAKGEQPSFAECKSGGKVRNQRRRRKFPISGNGAKRRHVGSFVAGNETERGRKGKQKKREGKNASHFDRRREGSNEKNKKGKNNHETGEKKWASTRSLAASQAESMRPREDDEYPSNFEPKERRLHTIALRLLNKKKGKVDTEGGKYFGPEKGH